VDPSRHFFAPLRVLGDGESFPRGRLDTVLPFREPPMNLHPKSYHAWRAATPTRAFPTLLEGRAAKSFTKAIFWASPSSRNLPLGAGDSEGGNHMPAAHENRRGYAGESSFQLLD
jgi:hypothetical protein